MTKALADRLRELAGKATSDPWFPVGYDESHCMVDSEDDEWPVAQTVEHRNAALIVELRNNLTAIIAALDPPAGDDVVERARAEAFEEAAVISETWFDKHRPKQPEKSRFNIYDIQHWAKSATRLVAEDIRARAATSATRPAPAGDEVRALLMRIADFPISPGATGELAMAAIASEALRILDQPATRPAVEAMAEALRDALGALRPFAKLAEDWTPDHEWSGKPPIYEAFSHWPTIDDTRRARAAAEKLRAALSAYDAGKVDR